MSSDIAEAKRRLPLPALMHRLGLGDHAKQSARCPFHDDKHNSFSVWRNDAGVWFFKCHAGCGQGDEIAFLELHERISTSEAIKLYLGMASVNGETQLAWKRPSTSAFDWRVCVEAVTEKHLQHLAAWRGYSLENVREWHRRGWIGLYDDCIAFPVHDTAGVVVAAHYRQKDGSWRYYPAGLKVRPLVIGELVPGEHVHVCESTWDGFDIWDKGGEGCGAIVITRGASNGAPAGDLVPENSTAYLWTQNDSAGEKWQRDVCAKTQGIVKRVTIPAPHKDVNEWTRSDATVEDLVTALTGAQPIEQANKLAEVAPHPLRDGTRVPNSLNSHLLSFELQEDYPAPLDAAAFHGLAGEIVRRIEPHTEADPAALLFQFLAAFGNIIGRTAYMVADGARHYLNLFGVLVGESSKGRKGTSWHQIVYVLQHVDEEWRNNIANGLSSGEGLIWAVRDPITETRPVKEKGRHTGEYETVITDHGIADKRLFVVESEFANVLKVRAREGNTLSPVIRSAWESGRLRTMVKNFPARATEAHISIIGHITRAELRRLLTQTESANGFGNRFNWLAVKRSKCLPEGGKIEQVNLNDVIMRLVRAIDFAQTVGELRRSEEARELWRSDYPKLSEGKPGMLGAVIGRAEAQVMRTSAIYALLDLSQLIRPEHHLAAMAMWSYSEQSAQWIFGTKTGDRNADKILVALRHSPNGMTKTEISGEVFNRHAPSLEIDEALRLLHGLKMVTYKTESTAGAPTQRWFSTAETGEKSE
jgi:hypothetical protein